MDSNSVAILDSIRRIVRALRVSSRQAERSLGLSGAQLYVIQKLAESRVLSLNELAERTHTHQSSVSVVVARLVENGLVTRKVSKSDARRVELSLTAAGRARLRKAPTAAQQRIVEGIASLTRAQSASLASLLREIIRSAGLDAEPATLFFEEEKSHARKNDRYPSRRTIHHD